MVIRQCAACKIYEDREKLIRLTFIKQNSQILINEGNYFGRSLYICQNTQCRRFFANNKKIRSYFLNRHNKKLKVANQLITIDSGILESLTS